MPRSARKVEDEGIYHLLNRGNGQQKVFHQDGDYLAFLNLLGDMRQRYGVELYAYCLMPNHFHLLVKVQQGESLSRGMQWFMTSHVRRYHRHYGGSGHLWQGRYKSFVVEDDDHLLTVARYVEGNPVRASMVQSAADWAWSSHRERCAERGLAPQVPVPLVQGSALLDPLPVSFSDDWTTFVDTPLSARDLAKVRKKIERKNAAGGLQGLAPQVTVPVGGEGVSG